ncbi:MAG: hypothetical protein MMC23_008629 [Stictis urceolatum]|nr:hypothetical protein [Stictis urceolata]
MSRPEMPMTPAASTDIKGQEKTPTELSFSLGPPAIYGEKESSESSNASIRSDSSYRPSSPAPPPSSRKRARPAVAQIQTDAAISPAFSLPPPPSRSRKIIQMKPGASDKKSAPTPATEKKKAGPGSKSTTAATSKKTARKTAHSVIERRRRSKMNEEFDTMKEMIPACQGQSMHKLAILQAGIDYLRYLERCVADLKAVNRGLPASGLPTQSQAPTPRPRSPATSPSDEELGGDPGDDPSDEEEEEEEEEEDSDEEMEGVTPSTATSQAFTFVPSSYSSTQPSPAAGTPYNYPISRSSTLPSLLSPAFKPVRPEYSHSVESSPALLPNSSRDADHEATAALLMLNNDRRGKQQRKGGGGLSVQDLLSS